MSRKTNREFADIHEKLLRCAAAGILRQLEERGDTKLTDVLRTLDNEPKAIYSVILPNDFIGKDNKLLFPIINPMLRPQVNVTGLFLKSVTEMIKRSAGGIKKKNSEITTSEIIRRLERK